ncbi:MAG: class I SAM-dependent methyltransferase [Gammaproteobacteria bacterium]|nr:class I SAM-dependent methyltransferase [Gammaproteobacteria bacterium]
MTVPDFSCRLCGGRRLYYYYALGHRQEYIYYKCPDCQLVNYDLSAGFSQEQYTAEFVDPKDDTARFNADKDQTFDFIRKNLPGIRSMIDIGCGFGRLLYRAQQVGWRVKGMDLSESVARAVSQRLGVEVQAGDFLEIRPFPNERFDLVCLRHVLEHLPDSVGAMERISDLLKTDGYVLLEMPNIEALDKRWKRWLVDLGLHQRRFQPDFEPGHCNEFCRDSIEFLLERTGFQMLHWETYALSPLKNFFYNRVKVGNKARVLAQKNLSV